MRSIFCFLVVCFCFACSKKDTGISINTPPAPSPAQGANIPKTYLALGDSYTIGQGVQASQRFPAQTVVLLKQAGLTVAEPLYIAQTGWTTSNLQAAVTTENPSSSFDVVTLLIGVNDQYQRMDTGGYALRFIQLLQKAIQLAGGRKERVFVLSIPDYSVTPFVASQEKERVRKEIDLFNDVNKRITAENGVSYTDITPSTREAVTDMTLLASDNLHPSGREYQKWAEKLAPKINSVLK